MRGSAAVDCPIPLLFWNTIWAAGTGSGECVLGQVYLAAGNRTEGVPLQGQTLSISQNAALYTLLGVKFGGDGISTFKLPDLRAVAPNDMSYYMCVNGIFPGWGVIPPRHTMLGSGVSTPSRCSI
ncbi:tail fiber protein [Leucobacter soli]|uniref:tail fiber protein n=1 Tax=Leucobacter soli TaxID=2812850 RepID=UPI003611C0F6